jgi:YfiH family protein
VSTQIGTDVEAIRASSLGAVPHAFLGRRGGLSEGAMWGLNAGYGSGDDRGRITENRCRAIDAVLPGARLVTVYQVHSANAVAVEAPWTEDRPPQADAMVTDRPGLLLGILTADCAPVLLADPIAGVVGAAHAGWRGALAGVTDATIALMEEHGASRERIAAAVGPCIAQPSYEVDQEFRDAFLREDQANARFFAPGDAGKPHFDLQGYAVQRLIAAGIGEVESVRLDTYAEADRFFSYRRAAHLGEVGYGRQISMIAIDA